VKNDVISIKKARKVHILEKGGKIALKEWQVMFTLSGERRQVGNREHVKGRKLGSKDTRCGLHAGDRKVYCPFSGWEHLMGWDFFEGGGGTKAVL